MANFAQGSRQVLPRQVSEDRSGDIIARGVRTVGNALGYGADVAAAKLERNKRLAQKNREIEAELGYFRQTNEAYRAFHDGNDVGAMSVEDFHEQSQQITTNAIDGVLEGMEFESPEEEDNFRLRLQASAEKQQVSWLSDHETRVLDRTSNLITEQINMIGNGLAADGSNFYDAMAETKAVMGGYVDRDIIRPEKAEQTVRKSVEELYQTQVASMVASGNFNEARRFLEEGPINPETGKAVNMDGLIPADDRTKLRAKIDREEDRVRREAATAARQTVQLRLNDEIAMAEATGERSGSLSDEDIYAAYPDNPAQAAAIVDRITTAQEFNQFKTGVSMQSPEEDAATLQALAPEGDGYANEARYFEIGKKAIAAKRKALGIGTEKPGDPAAHVMANSPVVQSAFQEAQEDPSKLGRAINLVMAEQRRLGVPEERVRVLTDTQVASIAEKIDKAESGDKAAVLAGLEQTYGDHWERALKELVQQGDVDQSVAMLGLIADRPAAAQRLSVAMDVGEADLKKGLESGVAKDIRTSVGEKMQDFREAFNFADFSGQSDQAVAQMENAAYLMALSDYRRSGDAEGAATRAAKLFINDRHTIINSGRVKAVLPKSINGEEPNSFMIERGGDYLLRNVEALPIDYEAIGSVQLSETPAQQRTMLMKERVKNGLENGGFWTVDGTGKRMVLMVTLNDGSTIPLPAKGGGFVTATIAELTQAGVSAAPEIERYGPGPQQ